jgi:alpha-1,6-mannosyltransferase
VTPGLGLLALLLLLVVTLSAYFVTQAALGVYAITALFHGALYAAGVWIVLKRPARARDLILILAVALILRAIAVTAPATLTTDGLRYVWDGRIQWAGFNPYLWVPADSLLAHLRDALIYPEINQKETAVTIYPPFAQMLFVLATMFSDSLRGIQVVMFASECATVWAVLAWLKADNLPRERVLIYAWHPIPIWEFTSMAHIDSAATALLMLTIVAVVRGRQGLAGGLMAAAVLTKYFPLVLMPALWRRWRWRMPMAFVLTVVVLYLPYVWGAGTGVFGFLISHLDNEGYGTGYGFHIIWILRDFGIWAPSGRAYVAMALLILGALGVWALLDRPPDALRPEHLVILGAAFTLLTSPHYAWYFGWLIPLLARCASPSVLAFTLLAVIQNYPGNATWATATAFYTLLFGGFAVMASFEIVWRRSHWYVARAA